MQPPGYRLWHSIKLTFDSQKLWWVNALSISEDQKWENRWDELEKSPLASFGSDRQISCHLILTPQLLNKRLELLSLWSLMLWSSGYTWWLNLACISLLAWSSSRTLAACELGTFAINPRVSKTQNYGWCGIKIQRMRKMKTMSRKVWINW